MILEKKKENLKKNPTKISKPISLGEKTKLKKNPKQTLK